MGAVHAMDVEVEIARWRGFREHRRALAAGDVDELEDHLRGQVADLEASGLSPDEAFLVAVRRLGSGDAISGEFAREHSDRLWKQLVPDAEAGGRAPRDLAVALAFALAAAVAIKLPELFGVSLREDPWFHARNLGLFALPFLAGYVACRHRPPAATLAGVAALVAAGALAVNLYPLQPESSTGVLAVLALPVVLWFAVGGAHTAGHWGSSGRRMDFVRFTGEWAIYYALIALGGGVLVMLTLAAFSSIGLDAGPVLGWWVVPCGAVGAVVVAARLVEAKKSVVENMAPVLTRVFTPLCALMLVTLLVATGWAGLGADADRELLIISDLLLVVVLGLLLYSWSARDPGAPAGWFEWLQLGLVGTALAVDVLGLVAMATRISAWGPSPNKLAALGLNLLLLVNLAVSAVLLVGWLRKRRSFATLERWQTGYLPLFGAWAAVVLFVFPPAFAFA